MFGFLSWLGMIELKTKIFEVKISKSGKISCSVTKLRTGKVMRVYIVPNIVVYFILLLYNININNAV